MSTVALSGVSSHLFILKRCRSQFHDSQRYTLVCIFHTSLTSGSYGLIDEALYDNAGVFRYYNRTIIRETMQAIDSSLILVPDR